MAKKKKTSIKIVSLQYLDEENNHHLATISSISKKAKVSDTANAGTPSQLPPTGKCTCGEIDRCVNGVKYKCMSDPFGDCIWFKTSEKC